MKKLIPLICATCLFMSCEKPGPEVEVQLVSLPTKTIPESTLMSQSVITPRNLDQYLFLEDCLYIDLRSPRDFYEEGHVAGFVNIPFYDYIADFEGADSAFFEMTTQGGEYLGDVGSFVDRSGLGEQWILDTFDSNKSIIAISTAGVESCYFLNLLIQLGYDPAKLYNAGSFTTGMGEDIAYRAYSGAQYLVPGTPLYDTEIIFRPLIP